MQKLIFLDAATVGSTSQLETLRLLGDVVLYPYTKPDEVLERIWDATIILTNKVVLDQAVLAQCPRLKLICITATGVNNVDVAYAKGRGIPVVNAVGYAVESVAQHTFALLLHLLHHVRYYDDYVKEGHYSLSNMFSNCDMPFYELAGKQLGIIGLGNIGRAVARIAEGFGMHVVYHSASGQRYTDVPYQGVTLDELLAQSNVVSINAPLNRFTQALINYDKLALMKPSGILLNMGRGGIVVEEDLVRILDEKRILGAGVDVFQQEPIPIIHPYMMLRERNRLVLTPHNAWTATESRERLMEIVVTEIRRFIEKERSPEYVY